MPDLPVPESPAKPTLHALIDEWLKHEPDSPLGRAFLAGALNNLDVRLTALEPCKADPMRRDPHYWIDSAGKPASQKAHGVNCAYCKAVRP